MKYDMSKGSGFIERAGISPIISIGENTIIESMIWRFQYLPGHIDYINDLFPDYAVSMFRSLIYDDSIIHLFIYNNNEKKNNQ